MVFLHSLLTVLTLLTPATLAGPHDKVYNIAQQWKPSRLEARAPPVQEPSRLNARASSRWLTNKTEPFAVDGNKVPDVNFDIGESYSGLLPISDDPDETRKLFFWFFPSKNPAAINEIVFWFNGGPGCSSLLGFLTENGKISFEAGTLAPTNNPYAWSNLTNMIWIEQPIGVGYSQGTPNITNEVELSAQLLGFYRQFMKTFETQGYNIYVTGESYGGYYVPYVANAFIEANDTDMPLKGINFNDPIIADGTVQQQVPILAYVEYWQNVFYLNDTFMEAFRQRHKECGYTDYQHKYLRFPPPHESFPALPDPYASRKQKCDQLDNAYKAITEVNPCFNVYHITEQCPFVYSHTGIINQGDYTPPGAVSYFNRTDVKKALHAPLDSNWMGCSAVNVFGGPNNNQSLSDTSLGPAQNGVLVNVIEHTQNVMIGSGNLDSLLTTNGTLLAIQNMTWGGLQGFQSYPNKTLYAPYHPDYNQGAAAGAGNLGLWGCERGLTFYQAQLAGHELPGYTAGVGYRSMEILLGRIRDFSDTSNFVGQTGNYTGSVPLY